MLPSTSLLQRRGFYRLTLEDASPWWGYWGAGTAAQKFYENLASLTLAFAAGVPSSPVNGVWVQDISISDGAGNLTVADLTTSIESRFYVTVRDVRELAASDVGTGTVAQQQRDTETQQAAQEKTDEEAKTSSRPAWLNNLLDVLKEIRGIVALVVALGVLWYVGPWIVAAARAFARKRSK